MLPRTARRGSVPRAALQLLAVLKNAPPSQRKLMLIVEFREAFLPQDRYSPWDSNPQAARATGSEPAAFTSFARGAWRAFRTVRSALGRIRTSGLLGRNQLLGPLSYEGKGMRGGSPSGVSASRNSTLPG